MRMSPQSRSSLGSSWLQSLSRALSVKESSKTNFAALPELVSAQAAKQPRANAVVAGAEALPYAELEARSNALARHLQSLGAKREALVAIFLDRSPASVMASLGILKSGAAYLPLDPSCPAERIRVILDDAGDPLVVTNSQVNGKLPEGTRGIVDLSQTEELLRMYSSAPVRCNAEPSQLAYVIYTSGSSGRPKGVEITHGNLSNLVQWHQSAFAVSASDHATILASPGFDASVWEIWPYLSAGATLHVPTDATRVSPRALRDWMVSTGITISFVPTPVAQRLVLLDWPAEARLRFLLTGADVLQQYPPAGLPFALVNNYGPTECTVVSTSGVISPLDRSRSLPSIGRPITKTEAFVLDERLQQVPSGSVGELHIAGANVGRGYLNNPVHTQEKFIPNPFSTERGARLYKTGDLVRALPDGRLEFLGRTDDQVKIRGYRVEPNEVSLALSTHHAIHASVVVARKDRSGANVLVAYVIPKPGTELNAANLRKYLQDRVPDYMIPNAFVLMGVFPLTTNGKIDRTALPPPNSSNTLRSEAPQAALTSTEETLAGIVASLLKLTRVNVNDNFFLLGGHSLLGAQLIAEINSVFGVDLPLRTVFDYPSVAGIAAELERCTSGEESSRTKFESWERHQA